MVSGGEDKESKVKWEFIAVCFMYCNCGGGRVMICGGKACACASGRECPETLITASAQPEPSSF
jgi:hypothetical protein